MTKPKHPEQPSAKAKAAAALAQTDISAAATAGAQPRSRDVCTVGLKMPNGLSLQLYRFEDHHEPVFGGGTRKVARAIPVGERVTLFGNAVAIGKQAKCTVLNGFALTPNVSLSFMQEWMKQNENHDLVKNKLIFIQSNENEARAQAKDLGGAFDGLQPLNPDLKKEQRVPRPANSHLAKLSRDTTDAAERAGAAAA